MQHVGRYEMGAPRRNSSDAQGHPRLRTSVPEGRARPSYAIGLTIRMLIGLAFADPVDPAMPGL